MLAYIARRVLVAVPVLLAVVFIAFLLMRAAPGGPFDAERQPPKEVLQALNERYKTNLPVHRQFLHYIGGAVRGDMGPSYRHPGFRVEELIAQGLPVTAELALYALLISVLLGGAAGVAATLRPNSGLDHGVMAAAMIGICLPTFLLGPLLALVFGVWLGWLPSSGWGYSPGDKILPSITLGAVYTAYIARLTRTGVLDVLGQDFVRTARAKGMSEARVLLHHVLRGGLAPVVAFLGPACAGLLAGSFVVETVFQVPGLGKFFVQAAYNRDYTLILGTTVLFSTFIILFNLLSDILLLLFDPRTRRQA